MEYTLITKQGKVMQFFILAVAEMYRDINGGVVISSQILEPVTVTATKEIA